MLRVVVAAPPAVRTPADLAALPPCADLVELRLDLLGAVTADPAVLARWIGAAPRPVLATVRSRGEGGAFAGAPREAAACLAAAATAGAAWVDVESDVAPLLPPLPATVEVLASHHGAEAVRLPREAGGRRVRRFKVAREAADDASLAALAGRAGAGVTLVPYGPLGALRVAFTHQDSLLYGSAGDAVVAGQPTLLELLDDLRAGEVGPDARRYGLLGVPPSRSPSPALHNAALRHLGAEAVYVPLPGLALEAALALDFAGYSVTTPYKGPALARAVAADERTRRIGAANTLVRVPGGWRAANTDADAVAASVPAATSGEGAFVFGAGGFARAAGAALEERGYAVRVAARDPGRARALADELGWEAAPGGRYERRAMDAVVVNATPQGADGTPPEFVADAAVLDGLHVLDAPYAAAGTDTGLVALARSRALHVVDGRTLLARQARGQVLLFTGREIPPDVLDLALAPPRPLVLLGLRGAGKTTVGRAVARRLGRPFVDLDAEVERITGRTPADWIRAEGEARFREHEADAVSRVAGRRGVVVAAGGGVLEHARSHAVVARETVPVWLDLPPETAAGRVARHAGDRPALAGATTPLDEARLIFARRAPGWREVARRVVDAARGLEAVVDDVVAAWRDAR